MLVSQEGRKSESLSKIPRSKARIDQRTMKLNSPVEPGRNTLVEGECSYNCTIRARSSLCLQLLKFPTRLGSSLIYFTLNLSYCFIPLLLIVRNDLIDLIYIHCLSHTVKFRL